MFILFFPDGATRMQRKWKWQWKARKTQFHSPRTTKWPPGRKPLKTWPSYSRYCPTKTTGTWEPETRQGTYMKRINISTILTVAFSSVCGPTYHWGGLLASLAPEAKRRYNAIRSNIGPSLEDSAKLPTGQLDLQFLQFWIKRNAWDVTKRSVWQIW